MDSEVQSEQSPQYWVKPEQYDEMRHAVYDASPPYLQARDRLLLRALYTWGLRVSEAVALDVEMIDLDDEALRLPTHVQKDYPNGNSPPPATLDLTREGVAEIRDYLRDRWKDSDALFPSRSSPRMTTRAAENAVGKLAEEAGVQPYSTHGRGQPGDVTPHTLRHSVAYRMIEREGESLDAVQRRLRHATILTTQREYSHFDRV
ncbi:site-specific integrase [Halorussus limi]|uniref:Site-specific integrase n=1 Tax=Halorussus limi TaxID=2938695 RepID=A0A8U0HQQ8_9EURY|nr:site-specific integrase [Halorussus limi]UPV73191.1 site-specific integrase [Halorussus limi]